MKFRPGDPRPSRCLERDISNVCLCGCGAAIPSVTVDGKPMLYAPHHRGRGMNSKLERDHRRILERIRSIPPRPTLYSDDG